MAELADGDRDFVLVIPSDWSDPPPGSATGLVAYASTADPAQAQVAQGLLQQAVGAGALRAGGGGGAAAGLAPPVASSRSRPATSGYIDFLVPGIVGMTIMQLGLFGVAFGFVQLKRTGALRRLFATPTSPSYFLSAQVLSRLIIGIVQVAILFAIGIWFGLQMFGELHDPARRRDHRLGDLPRDRLRDRRMGEERGPGRPGGQPHQPADDVPLRRLLPARRDARLPGRDHRRSCRSPT